MPAAKPRAAQGEMRRMYQRKPTCSRPIKVTPSHHDCAGCTDDISPIFQLLMVIVWSAMVCFFAVKLASWHWHCKASQDEASEAHSATQALSTDYWAEEYWFWKTMLISCTCHAANSQHGATWPQESIDWCHFLLTNLNHSNLQLILMTLMTFMMITILGAIHLKNRKSFWPNPWTFKTCACSSTQCHQLPQWRIHGLMEHLDGCLFSINRSQLESTTVILGCCFFLESYPRKTISRGGSNDMAAVNFLRTQNFGQHRCPAPRERCPPRLKRYPTR